MDRIKFSKTMEESCRDFKRLGYALNNSLWKSKSSIQHDMVNTKEETMTNEEEYYQFIDYCNERDLIALDSPKAVIRLRVLTKGLETIEADGCSYNDALDNLNIGLQARLRSKIDALCEDLKQLEEMEI